MVRANPWRVADDDREAAFGGNIGKVCRKRKGECRSRLQRANTPPQGKACDSQRERLVPFFRRRRASSAEQVTPALNREQVATPTRHQRQLRVGRGDDELSFGAIELASKSGFAGPSRSSIPRAEAAERGAARNHDLIESDAGK
jgi:hypothetical protein